MARFGPIQTIPRGLLGLLNLKSLGRTPDELESFVQPTLDLMRLLIGASPEIQNNNFDANAFGFSGSGIVVPNNEVWLVSEVMLTSVGVLAAAQSMDWAPGWQDISGPGFICGDYKAASVGETPQIGFKCNGLGYAVIPPAAEFGCHVRTFATGPIAAQMSVRFQRCIV